MKALKYIKFFWSKSICKALSVTVVNVVPEDLHACHQIKRSDKVIVEFQCHKEKQLLTVISFYFSFPSLLYSHKTYFCRSKMLFFIIVEFFWQKES